MLYNPQTTIALQQGTLNFETTHGKLLLEQEPKRQELQIMIIKQKISKTSSIYLIYLSLLYITLVYFLIIF